jgi:hypothetical protein
VPEVADVSATTAAPVVAPAVPAVIDTPPAPAPETVDNTRAEGNTESSSNSES